MNKKTVVYESKEDMILFSEFKFRYILRDENGNDEDHYGPHIFEIEHNSYASEESVMEISNEEQKYTLSDDGDHGRGRMKFSFSFSGACEEEEFVELLYQFAKELREEIVSDATRKMFCGQYDCLSTETGGDRS